MPGPADDLAQAIADAFGDAVAERRRRASARSRRSSAHDALVDTMRELRDRPAFRFEVLVDVCGVD